MPTSHFTDDGDASETGHGKHSGRTHGGDRPGGPQGASASRRGPGEARSCAAGDSGDSGPSGRGLGGRGAERPGWASLPRLLPGRSWEGGRGCHR